MNFGYEVAVTVVAPGLVVLLAAFMPVDEQASPLLGVELLDNPDMLDATVLLLAAMTVGTLLAAIMWVYESYVLDPFQAGRVHQALEHYDRTWEVYVDSLRMEHNSHVSRLVLFLYFQQRMAAALWFASVLWGLRTEAFWPVAAILAGTSGVMMSDAVRIHHQLARYRTRHFERMKAQFSGTMMSEDQPSRMARAAYRLGLWWGLLLAARPARGQSPSDTSSIPVNDGGGSADQGVRPL